MVISCHIRFLLLFALTSTKQFIKREYTNEVHVVASQSQPPMKLQQAAFDVHNKSSVRLIKVEPSNWNFGILPVGTVQMQTFTLININEDSSVNLNGIVVHTSAFYSSAFEVKTLPPLANTTFSVVFMPRESGIISSFLHIETSLGEVLLRLQGEGRPCPYRLKPIVGIQIPLNATITPLIYMHNPHDQQLKILEIYSSGGQFQLELPDGDSEAPQHIWQIPPYTMKPVIRVRFQSLSAGLHTAYVRIKLSISENSGDSENTSANHSESVLIIPLEFDVIPDYGLYIENPIIDFGYVAVHNRAKPMRHLLKLEHSNKVDDFNYTIQWINQTLPKSVHYNAKNRMLILKPTHLMDMPDNSAHEKEIILKFTTKRITVVGKVHTTTTTNHKLKIFIRYHITKGRLLFVPPISVLTVSDFRNKGKFKFKLTHNFAQSLTIYNVSLSSAQDVNIKEKPLLLLQPLPSLSPSIFNEEKDLMVTLPRNVSLKMSLGLLKENTKVLKSNQKYKFVAHTNATVFEIPVKVCSGRLYVSTQSHHIWRSQYTFNTELNLGTTLQPTYVILENSHPFKIEIMGWNMQPVKVVRCSVAFLGVVKEKHSTSNIKFRDRYNNMDKDKKKDKPETIDLIRTNYTMKNNLKENDVAVFRIDLHPHVRNYNELHDYPLQQRMMIWTRFENITVTINFTLSRGRLEVDQEKLHFENCFPGKICSSELNIRSTYPYSLHVMNINFTEPGLKFVEYNPLNGSQILADAVTSIGHIFFEPAKLCGSRCYIPTHTMPEITFPEMMINDKLQIHDEKIAWPPFDELELRRRTDLYRHFKWHFQHLDFTLTTREDVQFQLQIIIELSWPKLVVGGHQTIPVTEVNKTKEFFITIKNPADRPIFVDYVLADPTLAKDTQLFLPLEVIVLTPNCYLTDMNVFTLINETTKHPILISAGSSITVAIKFRAPFEDTYCTLLHIRNNLTLYEAVWVSAKAEEPQFRFHNLRPDSQTALLFEMNEQHVKNACSLLNARNSNRVVAYKDFLTRIFIARNLGELPIRIDGTFIGEQRCQDDSFRIANCKPFELKANSSHPIEIIFTPDFTFSRIMRFLILKVNNFTTYRYVLIGQLNPKGIEKCQRLIPRPSWESNMRQYLLIMLIITFIMVCIAALMDYKRIFFHHVRMLNGTDYRNQVQPPFNLRQICGRTSHLQSTSLSVTNRGSASPTKKKKILTHKKLNENDVKGSNLRKRNTGKNLKLSAVTAVTSEQHTKSIKRKLFFDNGLLSWNSFEPSTLEKKLEKMQLLNDDCVSNEKIKTVERQRSTLEENHSMAHMSSNSKPLKSNQRKGSKSNDLKTKYKEEEGENVPWMLQNDCKKDKDKDKNKDVKKPLGKIMNVKDDKETNEVLIGKTFHSPNNQKSLNNINKLPLGKTPGRERRKNINRNTKEITPRFISFSNSTSSCSSSTCSSTSLNRMSEDKRYSEHLHDPKDLHNSLKLFNISQCGTTKTTTAALSAAACSESFNDRLHEQYYMAPPWVTFRDVLQSQTMRFHNNQSLNTSATTMDSNIRHLWQNPEYNSVPPSPHTISDLKLQKFGPIGSRKLSQKCTNENYFYNFDHEVTMTSSPSHTTYQDKWQPSEYTCTLNQQQQQKHTMDISSRCNNLHRDINCWPPPLNINAWSDLNSGNIDANTTLNKTSLNNTNNTMLNSWGIPLIRPPPGLENKYVTPSQHHQQQQHHQQEQQQHQRQQHNIQFAVTSNNNSCLTEYEYSNTTTTTTTSVVTITTTAAVSPATAAAGIETSVVGVTINGTSMDTSSIALFDPFGLSAIWTTNTNHNNNNNTTNNNWNEDITQHQNDY